MRKEINVTMEGKVAGRVVGCDRIADIADLLREESEVFVVYDENAAWVAEQVLAVMPSVKGCIAVEATEEGKSMDTVLLIARSMLDAGLSRQAVVLAVGGGITTDMAGSPRPSTSAGCGMPMSRRPCLPRSMPPSAGRRGSISTITRTCWG